MPLHGEIDIFVGIIKIKYELAASIVSVGEHDLNSQRIINESYGIFLDKQKQATQEGPLCLDTEKSAYPAGAG